MNPFKIAALLAVLGLAAACNTVEGAGQDIAAGGEAVSDTAQNVQREINE